MQYETIKNSKFEINLSKIIQGSVNFGTSLNETQINEILNCYYLNGGNCIDTARCYSEWIVDGEGASERAVGKWLETEGKNKDIYVATKGGIIYEDGTFKANLDKDVLYTQLSRSLELLRRNCVDIYWLHRDDTKKDVSDIVEICNDFIEKGLTKFVGVSNWTTDRIEKANTYARKNNLHSFFASQIDWSVAKSKQQVLNDDNMLGMTEESYKYYYKNNMPVFAFASQANGFYTKIDKYGIDNLSDKILRKYGSQENICKYDKIKLLAEKHKQDINTVVLSYVFSQKLPAFSIISSSNLEQCRQSMSGCDFVLTQEEIDFLDNPTNENL